MDWKVVSTAGDDRARDCPGVLGGTWHKDVPRGLFIHLFSRVFLFPCSRLRIQQNKSDTTPLPKELMFWCKRQYRSFQTKSHGVWGGANGPR